MCDEHETVELSHEQLDALIKRVEQAVAEDIALSGEDLKLLLNALKMLVQMQMKLAHDDVTINKLRKLAGIVASSEKLSGIKSDAGKENSEKKPTSKKPPKPRKKPRPTQRCHHKIEGLEKGDVCPECEKSKVGKTPPAVTIRISGNSPLEVTEHIMERLRCSLCGAYFTAPLPEQVLKDGPPGQRYGYSARAIMVLQRYFLGAPFYRQESLQQLLGVPVSASTIFDQCEWVANDVKPIQDALIRLAGEQALVFYVDDTGNRILNQTEIERPDRRTGKPKKRKGIFTSNIVAVMPDNTRIVLYQTNIGHAGEFLDEVLALRPPDAPWPIIMGDAATRNLPSVTDSYYNALCNSHARRQFVDVRNKDPDTIDALLEQYGQIWNNEKSCATMSPEQRLAYHQQHSLPVMEALRRQGKAAVDSNEVEANSPLGQAWQYFIKHFVALSAFCRIVRAPIDNNLSERSLKLKIRGRKNSLFFRTLAGAAISDTLCTILATGEQSEVPAFEYLVAVQQHAEEVKANPLEWIPSNFSRRLSESKTYPPEI